MTRTSLQPINRVCIRSLWWGLWTDVLIATRNLVAIELPSSCQIVSGFLLFHTFIPSPLPGYWRVLWYQRGNQNPYIEEEQTTQWPNEKEQNDKQRSIKHTYKTKDRLTRTPLKTGDENRLKTKFFQFFFYQILTTFNKLKIMSEVAHDNLKWLTLWYITGYID